MERLIESQLKSYGCTVAADVWTAPTPAGPKPMKNILAKIPGKAARPVVISGHYDTKAMPGITFVGANDGGSSAGILLELARVLCGKKGADSVWLVWLDGEEAVRRDWSSEDSLYGSKRLASQWSADGTAGKVKALINVDMIGDRELNILEDMNSSTQLRQIVWTAARELNYGQYFTSLQSAIEDDHIPFARVGIPSLDIIDLDYGPNNSYWHTDRDTVDKLSAHSFQVVGEVLLRTLSKLGGM
jgi:Zn-dependent M28 family amino/carboxypeptidase